jgi:hypothetical protein
MYTNSSRSRMGKHCNKILELIPEKSQFTIPEKRTQIFAIGATVAPPQVSYGFHS